jgi:hypothetical protein
MLWLMAESAELFRSTLATGKLADVYTSLRATYKVTPGVNGLRWYTEATRNIIAAYIVVNDLEGDEADAFAKEHGASYSSQFLLGTLLTMTESTLQGTDFIPKGLQAANFKAIKTQARDLAVLIEQDSPQLVFNKISQLIHSNEGWKYPNYVGAYYGLISPEAVMMQAKVYKEQGIDRKVAKALQTSFTVMFE